MLKYPQIHVVAKYQDFLKKLSEVGKPPAVDKGYIKTLGFKSSYDANFLSAVKFIGLVEDKRNGSPTETWSKLRTNFGKTLAEGLKTGYSDLFSFYPDAHLRDEEALTNYFRGNSDEDADAVGRMVNAFIAVRELATFEDGELHGQATEAESVEGANSDEKPPIVTPISQKSVGGAQVNLNIQLQLPADTSGEVYDKFFEAMKKHGLI